MKEKLKVPISELELSVRSSNCLREARIKTIGDLVKKSELEMLKYRNFGKKSLAEINKILSGMGLALGMKMEESMKEPD
jgi:DNA-directed RNA polymerase subunit alpha